MRRAGLGDQRGGRLQIVAERGAGLKFQGHAQPALAGLPGGFDQRELRPLEVLR